MMQHANVAKITLLRCRREEKDALYNDDASLIKSIDTLANTIREQDKLMGGLVANTYDPS